MNASPPRGEKVAQQRRRLLPGHAAIDVRPVVARGRGEEPHAALDRAALWIGRPIIEPSDAGKGERCGAPSRLIRISKQPPTLVR